MKKVSLHGQLTFDEMKGSLERLPKTNRWVQMGDSLPWKEYEKVYNKQLKNDTVGASNRPGRMVCCSNLVGGKNGATPLAFLLNFNVTSHFNYLFSSPNLFHCVPQRSKAFQVVHHLADSKLDFGLVRYTGGTKNGVHRLSNDYQRYLYNKKGARKERHINRLQSI